jgi:hypothetical protein
MRDAKYQGFSLVRHVVLLASMALAVFGAVAALTANLATAWLLPAWADAERRADVAEIVALEAVQAADEAIDEALAVSCVYRAPVVYTRAGDRWVARLVEDTAQDNGTCVCQEGGQ